MTTPSVPRFDTDDRTEPTRPITLRLDVPSSYPEMTTELMRLMRAGALMLAEGVPVEVLMSKWMPREWRAYRGPGDWPPPEAQP